MTARTRRRWASSRGPGSTTIAADAPGERRIHVLVPSSVIGPGFGASTRVARSVTTSTVIAPSPRTSSHTKAASRPLQVSLVALDPQARQDRGDDPVLRRVESGGDGVVRRELGAAEVGRRQHGQLTGVDLGDGGRRGQPGDLVGLAGDVARLLAGGEGGEEEARVVPARLELRRDPVSPRAEQVRPQHQPAPVQEVGERQRPPLQRDPVVLPVRPGRVRDHGRRGRPGEQHAGLLERLPYGGRDVGDGEFRRAPEPLSELRRRRPGPRVRDGGVRLVHPAAGEHRHPRRERHRRGPPQQVHLRPTHTVAQQDHRRRRTRLARHPAVSHPRQRDLAEPPGERPGPQLGRRLPGALRRTSYRVMRRGTWQVAARGGTSYLVRRRAEVGGTPYVVGHVGHATSTRISTSTGASSGSTGTPTALRACAPASPNTWPSSSEAPFAICGWPVNSGVEATKASTLTTRFTCDRSTTEWTAASAFRAHWRAHSTPTSGAMRPPSLPVAISFPLRIGSWPEV